MKCMVLQRLEFVGNSGYERGGQHNEGGCWFYMALQNIHFLCLDTAPAYV